MSAVTIDSGRSLALITMLTMGLLACPPASYAGFGPAATARDWCKDTTLHYLKKRGYNPYNWAATTRSIGNNYVTKGVWSIDVDELNVECTTRIHGNLHSGRYKILGVEIDTDGKSAKTRQ